MNSNYLFRFVYHLFAGFALSLLYCAITGWIVWRFEPEQFQNYVAAYVGSFNCLVSAGLIIGTATFVLDTKRSVLDVLERSFDADALAETKYGKYRAQYLSLVGTLTFSGCYVVAAFFIFYFCRFPFTGLAEFSMIGIACAEYALGVYVGRKLFFIARMLDEITPIRLTHSVFRSGEINNIMSYVNICSTLTVIFVIVHVKSFYDAPFAFDSTFGEALKLVLLLPALIAAPVLVVFNFYPRVVLRKLFAREIESEVEKLRLTLRDEHLSELEQMSFIVEYDRLAKEEAKGKLQLSLSDLPMAVTILLAIVGILVRL